MFNKKEIVFIKGMPIKGGYELITLDGLWRVCKPPLLNHVLLSSPSGEIDIEGRTLEEFVDFWQKVHGASVRILDSSADSFSGLAETNFKKALDFVLKNEGGYVNHPLDRGGPTNMGITLNTLKEWRKKDVSEEDMRNLTKEEAGDIYKARYWDSIKGDSIKSSKAATCLFDSSVLFGPGAASKLCQQALVDSGRDIQVDSKIGPKTLEELNQISDNVFLPRFYKLSCDRVEDLVKRIPSQKVFLKGWKARFDKYLTL